MKFVIMFRNGYPFWSFPVANGPRLICLHLKAPKPFKDSPKSKTVRAPKKKKYFHAHFNHHIPILFDTFFVKSNQTILVLQTIIYHIVKMPVIRYYWAPINKQIFMGPLKS